MKLYKQVMLGFVLIVSLACGSLQIQPGAPSMPTSDPGAINTYIAQTAEVAYALTALVASPTPIQTSTPLAPETPFPTISVHIEQVQLDSDFLLIVGQLMGTLAETGVQSVATLSLFDSQNNKLLEQGTPCVETPYEAGKLCMFMFLISDPPADLAGYEVTGQIQIGNGSILTGHTEVLLTEGETQVNANVDGAQQNSSPSPQPVQPAVSISKEDVSVLASFSSLFYRPENGSSLNVGATYYGDSAIINSSNVELCVSIVEQRKYESGKATQIVLTDECKAVYFSGDDRIASASTDFYFKPSGYSFVSIDSSEGRYQISEIRASVKLEQSQQVLAVSEQSHRPVPVRVIDTSIHFDARATAKVEIMAGQGETYDLALKVYNVELDPDEIALSSFLFFIPCAFPGICDDRMRVGESFQSINLVPGTDVTISADFSTAQVSEAGNSTWRYEMYVFFDGIVIGKK